MIAPPLMAVQLFASQFSLPQIEGWAQLAIGRVLNSLPEGLLIALFAWAVLQVLPRQNSRTRFAVWFLALVAVVGIACLGGLVLTGLNGRIFSHSIRASSLTSRGASAIDLPAHWAAYLFIAWMLAACAGMARLAIGIFRLRELRASCTPVDAAGLDPLVRETIDELNLAKSFGSRTVTLATSERVRVPAALGLWKPMIVLPAWALGELAPSDLSIIVRHEFAHLRRWDDWTNLAQKILRALFFFHPAVWWIERRLSVEREMACDDVVVAQTDNPMGYASCLVSLLERSLAQRGWTMAQALVHRAREASERLAQILDKDRPAASGVSKPALGLVGAFTLLCVVMLPQTPQLVAFDRGLPSAAADHEYSAALVHPAILQTANAQTSLGSAAVIPPSLKLGEMKTGETITGAMKTGELQTGPRSPQKNPKYVPSGAVVARRVADHGIGADSNLASAPESLIEVSAFAGRNFQPVMHTLVFVEAVEFVPAQDEGSEWGITCSTAVDPMPAGTLWRVHVWRVMFVSPVWERSMRVPVASKI